MFRFSRMSVIYAHGIGIASSAATPCNDLPVSLERVLQLAARMVCPSFRLFGSTSVELHQLWHRNPARYWLAWLTGKRKALPAFLGW
jgi:hypothetical protein